MGRKLVLLMAFILVALVAAADYTMVLRDGRRIVAREKYVVDQGVVRFVGTDGQSYQFALTEVDLAATERANAPPGERPRKFIWTNDEIERLGLKGRINIVGPRPAEPAPPEPKPVEAAPAEVAPPEAVSPEEEVPRQPGSEDEYAREPVRPQVPPPPTVQPPPSAPAAAPAPAAEKKPTAAPAPPPALPRERDPEYYRTRLRPLQSELAQVERQIADIQRARAGKGGGGAGVGLTAGNPGVDPRDTLAGLQRQRDQLRAQIAALEAEARRNGLSPGQIR